MEKKALIVGINHYNNVDNLHFAVADAESVSELLSRNEDNSPNYACEVLSAPDNSSQVTRSQLRAALKQLFDYDGDVLLFFSGHGILTDTGGYLATSDAEDNDFGIPMQEVISLANGSKARNILILLDTCNSGAMGNMPGSYTNTNILESLRENITIIAASKDSEYAYEGADHGVFTDMLIAALDGGAADHMGWVTAPTIYSYIERNFDAQSQRPVYKSHATRLPVIRECAPLIERHTLQEITTHFATQGTKFAMDPDYEPEDEHGNVHEPVNEEKVRIARLFKVYRDAGLLRATEDEQLFWVARRSHTVELTLRGREYWRLVKNGRI